MNDKQVASSVDWVVLFVLIVSLCINVLLTLRLHSESMLIRTYAREFATLKPLSPTSLSELSAMDAPSLGPGDSPVTMIVFSDFQCVYCRRFSTTLEELERTNGSSFRLVFRELPLAIHPYARKEAELGACVAEQNSRAFWSLFKYMYSQADASKDSTEDALRFMVSQPGVNRNELNTCVRNHQSAHQVDHDVELARKYYVDSTPTVFLNGVRIDGAMRNVDSLTRLIQDSPLKRP